MAFELSIYAVAGSASTRVPFRVISDQDILDKVNYLLDGEDVASLDRVLDERSKLSRAMFGLPSIPPYPKPKINQWFHPAGGSRFGVFRGLMGAADIAQITAYRAVGGNENSAVTLRMQCGSDDVLSGQMYLLPPKELIGLDETDLYLVTLVDERYFWHWSYAGTGWPTGDTYTTTWLNMLADNSVTVSANYYQPDPDSPFFSAGGIGVEIGTMYDAAAQNVGRIVCQSTSGTTTNPTIYECAVIADAIQTALDDRHIMGGNSKDADITAADDWRRYHLPSTIKVLMPEGS